MENNKLLIGVQFTYQDERTRNICHKHIELYILRDISFRQLLTGIKYGLRKLVHSSDGAIYQKCSEYMTYCDTCSSEDICLTCINKFGLYNDKKT